MSETDQNDRFVLPVGTQVVTRRDVTGSGGASRPTGALGVLVATPSEGRPSYRVRFPDGGEESLSRQDFHVWKLVQREGLQTRPDVHGLDLLSYVIFRCVVGSTAYGLDQGESDLDRRGIFLPPADLQWSLAGVPETLDLPDSQEVYWELQKFLTLALKANPNVLECLYTPLVEFAAPLAEELLAMRSIFLSRLVYQTYNGYVVSQFKKLEQDVRSRGEIRWKHAMHLIRLLLSGITILTEGFVAVRIETYRDRLLAIRRGEVPWEEINAWRLSLHREFDQAFSATRLPDR